MSNATFSERLREAMDLRNMKSSQIERISEQLFNEGKIKKSIKMPLITDYLKGRYEAKQSNIYALALILNVDEAWLMGADIPMERQFDNYNSKESIENKHVLLLTEKGDEFSCSNYKTLPVIGKVKAGYNYLATENIIGYVYTDKKIADPENYFALKIAGDSMKPILYEDDIIIVHKQNDVESGQIGIVLIDSEEATVKKVIKYDDFIELIAFNSYYPPKRLDKNSKFQIIGKVTEARISKIFE